MTQAAVRAMTIHELARDQSGVLSRAQLTGYGVDKDLVRNHIRAGRWQSFGENVVVLSTGTLTEAQKAWAAVLEGGPRCILGGLSALQAHGLKGFEPDRVQCAVPLGHVAYRDELVVRRECRRLTPGAIHPSKLPPALRIDTALVDALENIDNRQRGCALMATVVQQRLLRPGGMRDLILAERTLPGRRTYLLAAGDIDGGAHSLLELNFIRLARAAGIRRPVQQSIRTDARGRRRYLDADFDTFSVEVDGAIHLQPLTHWADLDRGNDLVLTGRPILRFSSVAVRLYRERTVEQLRRAVQMFG